MCTVQRFIRTLRGAQPPALSSFTASSPSQEETEQAPAMPIPLPTTCWALHLLSVLIDVILDMQCKWDDVVFCPILPGFFHVFQGSLMLWHEPVLL